MIAGRDAVGFTLIEVVIVLTIIGLLAAIAIPQIDLERYQADAAMRGVGSTLLAAQRLAVTKQHNIVITFDIDTQAFLIHEDANNDDVLGSDERERRYPLGDKVAFGLGGAPPYTIGSEVISFVKSVRGMPALIFRRNGSASAAGGFYITTQRAINSEGINATDTRMIEVERSTGRASWFRYSSSGWQRGF